MRMGGFPNENVVTAVFASLALRTADYLFARLASNWLAAPSLGALTPNTCIFSIFSVKFVLTRRPEAAQFYKDDGDTEGESCVRHVLKMWAYQSGHHPTLLPHKI